MKRIFLAVLAAASICVVAVTPAAAQSGARLQVGAGLVMPMGDWGDENLLNDKMGFSFGAGASFGLGTAPIRLRVDASWTQTSHDGFDGNTRILGGGLNVVYPIQTAGNVKPYVLAGLTVNATRISDGTDDTSKTAIGFGGGAGLQFALSSANLFVEARYLTHKAFDLTFAQLPISVGVSFPLGKK